MRPALLLVAALLIARPAFAAVHDEWIDSDKDGRKEMHLFYEDTKIVRGEADMNGDGKIDRWIKYKDGKRYTAEGDRDGDGRMDRWDFYTIAGVLGRTTKDTNADGKPDTFTALMKGREIVMKEGDRNGDGKIDKRRLCQWTVIKRAGAPDMPGDKALWTEQDDDFDGKVDKYIDKKNVSAAKTKIGKPMDGRLTPFPGDPAAPPAPEPSAQEAAMRLKRTPGRDRVDALNARNNFESVDWDEEGKK